jgi:hypothetical protein
MPTLDNFQLSAETSPELNRATIVAACDVEISDFELFASQASPLRYSVDCRVLNKDLQYEDTVMTYPRQTLPREGCPSGATQHLVFEAVGVMMSDLHRHVFTRDELIAEFTLNDADGGVQQTYRSQALRVSLE